MSNKRENQPKVSIIIPVYNVERYLSQCLQSIFSQSNILDLLEVIIINDGSPDNSHLIIEQYVDKFPSLIRVVNQENQGLSMARNVGIEASTGEYITFIDSDDSIEPNMYKTMLEKAESGKFDIVACGVNVVYPDKTVKIPAGFDHDIKDKDVKLVPIELKNPKTMHTANANQYLPLRDSHAFALNSFDFNI